MTFPASVLLGLGSSPPVLVGMTRVRPTSACGMSRRGRRSSHSLHRSMRVLAADAVPTMRPLATIAEDGPGADVPRDVRSGSLFADSRLRVVDEGLTRLARAG